MISLALKSFLCPSLRMGSRLWASLMVLRECISLGQIAASMPLKKTFVYKGINTKIWLLGCPDAELNDNASVVQLAYRSDAIGSI